MSTPPPDDRSHRPDLPDVDPGLPQEPDAPPPSVDLNQPGPPTDDAPTVISRNAPRTMGPGDVLGGTLRGRRLAHFELIEPIGVGGMAAVIRARDTELDRIVALKILPPDMAADSENVVRFHREARAAAKLDHENIARVFYCGSDQQLHFIAFEFVEGVNLRTLLERRGRLPAGEAVHYMLQIASGLAHAQQRGVVHRDIKPSNIIISPNGRAKVVDMGLARAAGPQPERDLTQSGVTLGTFDYISPEQALEPREADIRSDIYSLGCTFYHALTGRPPVPEGTAAKKLHHHQHVAPIDPREIAPDIPDAVAAILARMMAKDPRARYQRPEHLVQHLMVVAQDLGQAPAGADSVLFVDAPLPSPPRARPVLLAFAALAALVVAVFFLGAERPPPPGEVALAKTTVTPPLKPVTGIGTEPTRSTEASKPGPVEPVTPNQGTGEKREAAAIYDEPVPQARSLADFLKQKAGAETVTVKLADELDLTPGVAGDGAAFTGLVFEGNRLVIEPKDPKAARPTIRLRLPAQPLEGMLAALTVKSGYVVLRHLRFMIDAAEAPGQVMAAVHRLGGQVQIIGCEFIQAHPPGAASRGRLSAVEVSGSPLATATQAVVSIEQSWFMGVQRLTDLTQASHGGQHAVTLTSPVQVRLTDCAFGPHTALVALQGAVGESRPRLANARVDLLHCSALLGGEQAAVFALENVASCQFDVRGCLFSQPGAAEGPDSPALIRQHDESLQKLVWKGDDNRYHNLAAFWIKPVIEDSLLMWADFAAVLQPDGQDGSSVVLDSSPWTAADPLALLEELKGPRLREAFALQPGVAELRRRDSVQRLVGVDQCAWGGDAYSKDLPMLEPRKTETASGRRPLVVDPMLMQSANGQYPTLESAIREARAGDTILIKHDGPLPIDAIRLVGMTNLDVVVRPFEKSRPELTLGDPRGDADAVLFRMHDGKLVLEDLHIRLRPAQPGFQAQAVVSISGEGECVLKGCVLTLDAVHGIPLAAVTLTDPGKVMMMKAERSSPPSGRRPIVRLDNCLVRGEGDLLLVRASRPLDLDADNSLVALTGSFLRVEGGRDEAAAAGQVNVRLERSTVYLNSHLLQLNGGKDPRGLLLSQFSAASCLFISGAGKSLVHLDGPDEDRLASLFSWEGRRRNAYVNFRFMVDQQPGSSEMAPLPYNQRRWKEFTSEGDAVFTGVRVAEQPTPDEQLARVSPARFRVRTDPDLVETFGVNLDRLPRPLSAEERSTTPE